MTVTILGFGIAREIFGSDEIKITLEDIATVEELRAALESRYPRLRALKSFLIAVNNEYATPGDPVYEQDEIAVIPPVSGG